MAKRKPKIERDYVVLVNGKEVSTVVGDSGDALQRAAQYVPLPLSQLNALSRALDSGEPAEYRGPGQWTNNPEEDLCRIEVVQ